MRINRERHGDESSLNCLQATISIIFEENKDGDDEHYSDNRDDNDGECESQNLTDLHEEFSFVSRQI